MLRWNMSAFGDTKHGSRRIIMKLVANELVLVRGDATLLAAVARTATSIHRMGEMGKSHSVRWAFVTA
jgi:hypothetical protein